MPTAVLLAETDVLFCAGVAHALREEPDFTLREPPLRHLDELATALATEAGAIVLVAEALIRNLAQTAGAAASHDCKLVLLTSGALTLEFSELPAIRAVLRKNADSKQLLACLRTVAAGKPWSAAGAETQRKTTGSRILAELSPRELQVMSGVSRGAKNIEIARELKTSEQVIKNMLGRIYDLAGVSDRLELALFVLHHPELAEAARQFGQTSTDR
ncbi:hypothetical protein GCM10022270_20080 [Terriglobus aquaticus]